MNKMKKLLSVLLAVLMILSSMTVMASAAQTSYKSVEELDTLDAYSDYGAVTRLSSEERMSIIFDYLDMVLPSLNLNMGTIVDMMGITITINFTSVDNMLLSIDSFKNTMASDSLISMWDVVAAIVNLGVLEDLEFSSWATGMTRDGTAQLTIVQELAQLLTANKDVVYDVISTGNLDLGLVASIANINIDLSIIADIPGLIKGMIYPMLERKDDKIEDVENLQTYSKGDGNIESVINNFVKGLFTKPMSTTTVKVAEDGTTITSAHQGFYSAFNDTYRYKYTLDDSVSPYTITSSIYTYDEAAGSWGYVEEKTFTLTKEYPNLEDSDYVYTAEDGTNIKWYEDDSYWLQEPVAIDLSTMSAAELLYTFIPVVFEKMAPVVINGSMKKRLGDLFGAEYKYVGDVGSEAVAALADYDAEKTNIFTMEQGDYLWEWSYYEVINDNHYYRFEDQIFEADLSNTNHYFDVIDYEYEITGDWMDEFVPANGGSTEDTLLENLNDFLVKTVTEVVDLDYVNAARNGAKNTDSIVAEADRVATNVPAISFETGSNAYLVQNIKEFAQAIITIQPESVFGSDYATNSYYEMMVVTNNDQTVLTGIAATVIDWLMPQMLLPTADSMITQGASVGAVLASVLRELATQLIPENNYDALIYSDYNTKTYLAGKDNAYWLDVILTMGMDIGIEYLHNLADLGGDTADLKKLGWNRDKVYSAMTQAELKAYWEALANYVIDWALGTEEYQWRMSKMVDAGDATDFWGKLDYILNSLLPADEIFNVTATDCDTELEQLLRYDFILSLVNLEWENIVELVRIPDGFIRKTNVLDQLATVLKNLINGLFKKIGGGSYEFIPVAITDFDTLANQSNLATMVSGLIGALEAAYNSGLLDVLLPFINFLLGWKTDPQVYSEPSMYFSNPNNLPYIYVADSATVSTTLNIANMASGMLERHRNADGTQWSDTVDQDYLLTIKSITCDDANITAEGLPLTLNPYGTAAIDISGEYTGDKVVLFTIVYEFKGKDGNAIGGEQTVQTYMYISNSLDYNYTVDAHTDGWQVVSVKGTFTTVKTDAVRVQREAFNAVKYGTDAKAIVENFTIQFTNTSANTYAQWVYSSTGSNQPAYVTANQSFVHGCTENETLKEQNIGHLNEEDETNIVNPLTWVEGTDTTDMVSGWVSNLGSLATVWHNHKSDATSLVSGVGDTGDVKVTINTSNLGEIRLIDTADLISKTDGYADVMKSDYDTTSEEGAAAWDAFDTAFRNAYAIAKMPYSMSSAEDFTAAFSVANQEALATALDEAYEALQEYALASGSAAATTGFENLEAALGRDTSITGYEINYQDYDLYEYWAYEDYRTLARDIFKSLNAPAVLDQYYIEGCGISQAELDAVIEAEDNAYIAAGITASRSENDAQAIADSKAAADAFIAPYYSKLYLDDVAIKLDYYRNFLIDDGVGKVADGYDSLYFLDKEIKYADAQNYEEAKYTATTWAAYENAYDYATEVLAGTAEVSTLPSTVFEAKYNLMVAEKNLMLKSQSLIENGGTADLLALMEEANAIFAGLESGEYAVVEGVDADTAYAQLIKALGYEYVGQDGKTTYDLYADSATEYTTYDRPNNSTNLGKVKTAENALQAAIDNFEAAGEEPAVPAVPALQLSEYGMEIGAVISTSYGTMDGFDGAVYGIDTLGIRTMDALEDCLTTPAGYININTDNSGGMETTGTIIELYDDDDNLVASYVFIYFGDVDMDGMISSGDGTMIIDYELTLDGLNEEYVLMAADVDGDGMPSSGDGTILIDYELSLDPVYANYMTQAEIAACYQ